MLINTCHFCRTPFFICHWNLNSISSHNFIKISLLRAYVSTHNFNNLCLSDTYLDSSTSSNDNNLTIPGYDLYRADHSSHVKRGEFVSTIKFSSVESNRHSISTRVHQLPNENQGKLCNFIISCRSTSQSQDDFETFLKNFELNLDTILTNNPFLTVVLGNFNVK